ncbi:MAG TPA: N-formylglutamate deformylase [Caulobacteraceae bacterium]|nr:N-formylglutamate deformylase [Caulobacteraceae bacterium]
MTNWLTVERGEAPLVVSIPHAGLELPAQLERRLVSPWLGRKDADWRVDRLYDFAATVGATIVRTAISRTVIDVNRDPSGASLYPGQATTSLCPTETFDGEPLWRPGEAPDEAQIAERRVLWFAPYHQALGAEIERLRGMHRRVVVYDAHSIRSRIPRLFAGELPVFNIGTYDGRSCDPELASAVDVICRGGGEPTVVNGRFKGGWTTRAYGAPERGVHAIQMELACRAYMAEPQNPSEANWPGPWDEARAGPIRAVLRDVLAACLDFAGSLTAA